MVREEIRRVLLSPFFYLAIVILLLGTLAGTTEDLFLSSDLVYLMEASEVGFGKALTPLVASLAVADTYLIEVQSGYRYAVLSRTSKRRYCVSKIGVAVLSGICVVVFMELILLAVLAVISLVIHGEFVFGGADLLNAQDDSHMPYWIVRRKFGLYVAQKIFNDAMYAALCPGLALAISAFVKNRYIVMLFPFLYVNVTTCVFIGLRWYYLAPMVMDNYGRAGLLPYEGEPYRILVVLIYVTVSGVVFARGVTRDMR